MPVALYVAFGSECSLHHAIRALHAQGVALCLPAEDTQGRMCFRRLTHPKQPLQRQKGGFLAPGPDAETVTPWIVMCPLLAFDNRGKRLGYGRGFYDRALSALRGEALTNGKRPPYPVGVAFACQASHAKLPADARDIPCVGVVTERGIFRPAGARMRRTRAYPPK